MTLLYVNYHLVIDLLDTSRCSERILPLRAITWRKSSRPSAVRLSARDSRTVRSSIASRSPSRTRPKLPLAWASEPCAFDTLKFTGPDTRFYWASTMNWKQYAKNLRDQATPSAHTSPIATNGVTFLQNWTRAASLDGERDIVDSLGSEVSIQAEWPVDTTYPEVGIFVKLDHPETFKPVIAAIISSVKQAYGNTATIKELSEGDQHFASLMFNQPSILSPTITEDGGYFGVFLSENQAVRSFKRDPTAGLAHNANFVRQAGDKKNGAAQILYLDSPYVLDRAYRTAMPYLTFAEMFNKDLAGYLAGKELPPDLGWLAPMGTWTCVITPDEEGIRGYSVSGIGNQGIFLSGALGGSVSLLQSLGVLPKQSMIPGSVFLPGTPPVPAPLGAGAPPLTSPTAGGAPFPALPTPPVLSNPNAADAAGAIISITAENKILFNQTPVPTDQIGDFLKAKKAANQGLKLAVKVDRNASPDILSTVMDAGASAGFGVLPYAYTSAADASTNADVTPSAPATNSNPLLNTTNADGTPITPDSLQPH